MTISLIQALGFRVNWEKSLVFPQQTLEFLGIEVNSVEMSLRIPQSTIYKIKTQCRRLAHKVTCSAKELSALIGLLTFTKVAIPVAPLFFRALQFDLISAIRLPGGYNQKITLSQVSLANLNWWTAHTPRWNSNPIVKREIDLAIQTDASLTGWGASSYGKRGMVSRGEDSPHQPSRIEGSLFWREVVCLYQDTRFATNSQHYDDPLHQQIWRHTLTTSMSAVNTAPAVHDAASNNLDSGIHSRKREHNCRLAIPPLELPSTRMAPLSKNIQQDPSNHPDTPQGGPVRLTSQQPTTKVCKLAPRSRRHSGERLCTRLAESGGTLHVPSTDPHWTNPDQAPSGENRFSDSNIPLLADQAMVAATPRVSDTNTIASTPISVAANQPNGRPASPLESPAD